MKFFFSQKRFYAGVGKYNQVVQYNKKPLTAKQGHAYKKL